MHPDRLSTKTLVASCLLTISACSADAPSFDDEEHLFPPAQNRDTTVDRNPSTQPVSQDLPEGAAYICGFEIRDLTGFGNPGLTFVVSEEGGIAAVVREGDNFSGLVGEESISFYGDFAVIIRSNDRGDPDTWGSVTTNPFVPEASEFIIDQLSEIDVQGIELELQILDASGEIILTQQLPVETGGHVPCLDDGQEPIDGAPQIREGRPHAGSFVRTVVDLSPYYYRGEEIQVRIRQRTLVDGAGFFTLLDNLCNIDL